MSKSRLEKIWGSKTQAARDDHKSHAPNLLELLHDLRVPVDPLAAAAQLRLYRGGPLRRRRRDKRRTIIVSQAVVERENTHKKYDEPLLHGGECTPCPAP